MLLNFWVIVLGSVVLIRATFLESQNSKYLSILTHLEDKIPQDSDLYPSWNQSLSDNRTTDKLFLQIYSTSISSAEESVSAATEAIREAITHNFTNVNINATTSKHNIPFNANKTIRSVWLCVDILTDTRRRHKIRHQKQEQVTVLQQLRSLSDSANSDYLGAVTGILLNFTQVASSVAPRYHSQGGNRKAARTISRELAHKMIKLYARVNKTFEGAWFPYKLGIIVDYHAWCGKVQFPRKVLQLVDTVVVAIGHHATPANFKNIFSQVDSCASPPGHSHFGKVGVLLETTFRQESTLVRKNILLPEKRNGLPLSKTLTESKNQNMGNTYEILVGQAEERKSVRLYIPREGKGNTLSGFGLIIFWITVSIGALGCICRFYDFFNDDDKPY